MMNITKIIDFLSKKNVNQYYNIYTKTQWYSKNQMHNLQLAKLQALIFHCYTNVPFYKEYMDEHEIKPIDIQTLEDLKLFPIITKEIIKENYNKFTPVNINDIKGVKTSQTGGTTGNILIKRNDANTRSSVWATFKRFEDWMGIKEFSPKLILMGGHVMTSNFKVKFLKKVINLITNSTSFTPYDTTSENIDNIINALSKKKFSLIRSYSQFMFFLAQRIKDSNIRFNIKAITTTAEPLLYSQRKLFKEVFNSKIFDQYGCGEIGGVAYECNKHNGLHIAEERVIVELNNENELIITDLDNFSMPFIRYWNADQAIISDEECSCGRKSKLIKKVLGRTCDYIIGVNGEFLHWAYFWHLFFDSKIAEQKNLKKFQVVQETKNHLVIRFVCDDLTIDEMNILSENIKSRLGEINVTFSFEDDIENSISGKYRPVINKLI